MSKGPLRQVLDDFLNQVYEPGYSAPIEVLAKKRDSFVSFDSWSAPTMADTSVVREDTITMSGRLYVTPTRPLSNRTIYVFDGVNRVASGVSDSDGYVNIPVKMPTGSGSYSFNLEWDGDKNYNPAKSISRTFTVEARIPAITLGISPSTLMPGDQFTWGGEISDPKVLSYKLAGDNVFLQESADQATWNDVAGPIVTDLNGIYSGAYIVSEVGTFYYRTRFPGGSPEATHEAGVSPVVLVQVTEEVRFATLRELFPRIFEKIDQIRLGIKKGNLRVKVLQLLC